MANVNSAVNPFDLTDVAFDELDERITVGVLNPDLGLFGVRLKGSPRKDDPSTIAIYPIDSIPSGIRGPALTEITSGAPLAGSNTFRVDYGEADKGFGSGIVWIDPLLAATPISADYKSMGDVNSVENVQRMIDDAVGAISSAVLRGAANIQAELFDASTFRLRGGSTFEVDGTNIFEAVNVDVTLAANNFGSANPAPNQWYAVMCSAGGVYESFIVPGTTATTVALTPSGYTDLGGDQMRVAFSGAPDLSGVQAGEVYRNTGATDAGNNGIFEILAVDDVLKHVDVDNSGVVTAAASGAGQCFLPTGDVIGGGATVRDAVPRDYEELSYDPARNGFYDPFDSTRRIIAVFGTDGSGNFERLYALGNGREWKGGEGMEPGDFFTVGVDHVPPYGLERDGATYDLTAVPLVVRASQKIPNGTYAPLPGFNMWTAPDFRGEFERGRDNGRGADPDSGSRNALGAGSAGDNMYTWQNYNFHSHAHGYSVRSAAVEFGLPIPPAAFPADSFNSHFTNNTNTTGGNQTNPRNIYVIFCFKVG